MTKWKIRGKDKRQKKDNILKQSTTLGKNNARTKLAFFHDCKRSI